MAVKKHTQIKKKLLGVEMPISHFLRIGSIAIRKELICRVEVCDYTIKIMAMETPNSSCLKTFIVETSNKRHCVELEAFLANREK
jgi:hypothetical protein